MCAYTYAKEACIVIDNACKQDEVVAYINDPQ